MKPALLIYFLITALTGWSQTVFRTVVQRPVVEAGKPFNVNYVLENSDSGGEFIGPAFIDLRWVSGPQIRRGLSNGNAIFNYVFTIVAPRPGQYEVPGATINVNGRLFQSKKVLVTAVEAGQDTDDSEFYLRPGEDPYRKMQKNLFMKVMADKTHCTVGEPIVATFKLYSRLQSRSDIVKNPGFYGFTVHDVINLDDNISETETINGKLYAVHTIRTVQLYPLQPGEFSIDPMEIVNKVEFSRSVVNKKTEQEISEGVFEDEAGKDREGNTVTYENHISTQRIAIHVKPYPDKGRPAAFSGATGRFTINAILEQPDLSRNEEGDLLITVKGQGNFSQLPAPAIQWPDGIEGFEATVTDSVDVKSAPLKGKRTFRFPFIASRAGIYHLPAVSLAFFDIDSNKYKIVSSGPVELRISYLEKTRKGLARADIHPKQNNSQIIWLLIGGLLLPAIAAGVWLLLRKRTKETPGPDTNPVNYISAEEALEPAYPAMKINDSRFYSILQKGIWDYLGPVLGLAGSRMNKMDLEKELMNRNFSPALSSEILALLQECEAAAFTSAEFVHDKQELLSRARRTLDQVKPRK